MPIMTDGPVMEPENKGIDEFHVGRGASLGATAQQTFADSPVHQLFDINETDQASGKSQPDFGQISTGEPTTGPGIAEDVKPAEPNIDMIDANDRVKKAGLSSQLTLPDQPDIPPAQLAIMMDRARRRQELETTIDRGPQGFVPSALSVGTSFLVGAVDPLNAASAFVPVMGEMRYGKLLASAGDSLASRLAVRATVGAAEGAAGQAALEPLDWWSHTQDGRDFGMADVLHNLMFGAALGGGLHAGGGFISDAYRGAKGKPLYPFGPSEPMENVQGTHVPSAVLGEEGVNADTLHDHFGDLTTRPEALQAEPERVPGEALDTAHTTVDINGERTTIDTDLAAARAADMSEPAPPSPAVMTINDLPQRAHEDAMRGAIANLIDGEPVRSGEMLEAAAQTDPRIAESFDHTGGLRLVSAPEGGVYEANQIKAGEQYFKALDAEGNVAAEILVRIDGGNARIEDILNPNAPREEGIGSLGARQLRGILNQFREMHPEVSEISGERVSGARRGGKYSLEGERPEATVSLSASKVPRGRAAADPQTWSLFEFLSHEGGLKPDPELQAVFGTARGPFVHSFGPLVRPNGRTLDDALRLAKDHGYLFDAADVTGAEGRLTPNDLLDRLAEENSGRRQYRNDQDFATKGQQVADLEREKHEIISALHDEVESGTGVKGTKIDPRLEDRVVEIMTREGEDEERYNAETGQQVGHEQPVAGRDVSDDARAASAGGAAAPGPGAAAGDAGSGPGANAGGKSRPAGRGNGTAPQAQLERDAAWRQLAQPKPEFDDPDIIAASQAASEVKPPPTKLDERVSAAEKADAFAKQMYDMFADRLPEGDRQRLDDLIKRIDDDHEAREIATVRGGSCLFGVL